MSLWKEGGSGIPEDQAQKALLGSMFQLIYNFIITYKLILKLDALFFSISTWYLFQAFQMLEHATYLETVALRLCHDVVQIFSATLEGINTTKIFDLLEGTLGVNLPKDDEDDDEVESAQSADKVKFSIPAKSPSTTHK